MEPRAERDGDGTNLAREAPVMSSRRAFPSRTPGPPNTPIGRQVEDLGRKLFALLRETEELELRPPSGSTALFPPLCIAAGRLIEAGVVELFEVQGRLYIRRRPLVR